MIINFSVFYLGIECIFLLSNRIQLLQIVDKKTAQIAEHLEQQDPNIKSRMLIKENTFDTFERYDLLNCNRNNCNPPEVTHT
jgi:hypothetical protein